MANVTEEVTEVEVDGEESITAKELAQILGVDPKTCRRFLRGLTTVHPGKGGRWAIELSDLDEVKAAWDKRHKAADEADDEVIEDLVDAEDEDKEDEDILDEI